MSPKWGIGANPLAWANVIFILLVYGMFAGLAVMLDRAITWSGALALWPLHIVLAINLFAIFGPRKSKP